MPDRDTRALVVDDNEGHRQLISAVLESQGLRVSAVRDGREAVEVATAVSFALILMDVSMPIMDGLTATRLIRQYEAATACRRAEIIMVTSHGTSADVARSQEAGADLHVTKPVNVVDLVKIIEARRANAPSEPAGDAVVQRARPRRRP